MSQQFRDALKKAVLGSTLRQLLPPKSPSLEQLKQGLLGVGGEPAGHLQGMWGEMFGAMTAQEQRNNLQDDLIKTLLP